MHNRPRVSVIMPFLNAEKFIQEAVGSVLSQSFSDWELLLVDDGSSDASTGIARAFAEEHPHKVRYYEHPDHQNRGASASRNLGIRNATGEYVALLDADDVWLPRKLQDQVALLDAQPEAGSLYGNTLFWFSWAGDAANGSRDYLPGLGVPTNTLLHPPVVLERCLAGRASVPCTCSLLVRRSVVEEIGGFEEEFQRVFTDQAFYTKLFLAAPVYVVDGYWEKYRQHANSSCSVTEKAGQLLPKRLAYLRWAASYIAARGMTGSSTWRLLQREIWWHSHGTAHRIRHASRSTRNRMKKGIKHLAANSLPAFVRKRLRKHFPGALALSPGGLHFGPLHRLTPVSRFFGFDRGQPVDRYYVEAFLARHAPDIRGRVLEIGDDYYTRKFGGNSVAVRDVLHVKQGNPKATVIADLANGDEIPSDAFDCIIVTQTLHLIFDMARAVDTIHRVLKPGGVCLATVPGISQLEEGEWRDTWYWSLTELSARRLFQQRFEAGLTAVESHGNVLTACAFLQGLAAEELHQEELDYHDPTYPVLVTIRAQKAGDF